MGKAPSTWKSIELKICRMFGGERSGPLGKDTCDCIDTDPFGIEIKHGSNAPLNKLLKAHMQQAHDNCPPGLVPTLVLHPKGIPLGKSWVCFELDDFLSSFEAGWK